MTTRDLKQNIIESEIKIGDTTTPFERGYNLAMQHALMFVELYERYKEKDYPLGYCPEQE